MREQAMIATLQRIAEMVGDMSAADQRRLVACLAERYGRKPKSPPPTRSVIYARGYAAGYVHGWNAAAHWNEALQ